MTIRCITLDDTPFDLEALADIINQSPELELLGQFDNPAAAKEFVEANDVDLIFSDIEMPDTTGLEFVKSLADAPAVIFVSSHPELAIEGFDLAAIDFISKPLTKARFRTAMQRVTQYFGYRNQQIQLPAFAGNQVAAAEFIVVKDGHDLVRVNCAEIIYAEANGDFVNLHTESKKYLVLVNLKHLLPQLPAGLMVRCHKSYAVNPAYMKRMNNRSIHLSNNVIVPVGNESAAAIEEVFVGGRLVKRKVE